MMKEKKVKKGLDISTDISRNNPGTSCSLKVKIANIRSYKGTNKPNALPQQTYYFK